MTGSEFIDWLDNHPKAERGGLVEGYNLSGFAIKFRRTNSSSFAYFSGPFDDRKLSNRDIKDVCDSLHLEYPDGIN